MKNATVTTATVTALITTGAGTIVGLINLCRWIGSLLHALGQAVMHAGPSLVLVVLGIGGTLAYMLGSMALSTIANLFTPANREF